MAPGCPVQVVRQPECDLDLGGAGRRDARQRLHVLPSGLPQDGPVRQCRHRPEYERPFQDLPGVGGDRPGTVSLPGRLRRLPQRADGPWRGHEHDAARPPRHDLRLHAGRLHLQREAEHPAGGVLQLAHGRRRARR